MAEYCGIKIFDKVIIVEKTWNEESTYSWKGNKVNQGYVVDFGNSKMLESAKNWAEWTSYNNDFYTEWTEFTRKHSTYDRGTKWDSPENEKIADTLRTKYYDSKQVHEGIVHEYDNGTFEIILDEAAGSSSQGGKLSFWNCLIKAHDGKMFLIGISSDLLLHLMMKNTFVNGACQSKIWLGRIKGKSVGAFTENMDEFIQGEEDEKLRQQAAAGNSRYVPGDIVGNFNSRYVYIGSFYSYITRERYQSYSRPTFIYNKKPKIIHLFSYLNSDETTFKKLSPTYNSSKPKYNVYGHVDLTKSAYEYIKEYLEDYIANNEYPYDRMNNKILLYSFADTKTADLNEIKANVNKAVAEYLEKHHMNITFRDEEEYNNDKEKYRN